jgi:hypothetical protein
VGVPAEEPQGGPNAQWGPDVSPLERVFDDADTDGDGALTKEEIRSFHEGRRGGRPFRRW